MLILQGDKDYQVSMIDFKMWKIGLREKENVTYRAFAGVTHLFSQGDGVPADYNEQHNVDLEVILTMLRFIQEYR